MEIRHTTSADLPRIAEIYARARTFMAAHGNPNQWGPTNWPPMELIREDTHTDNVVMQNLLGQLGFTQCGIIHVVEDNYPRLAYEIRKACTRTSLCACP